MCWRSRPPRSSTSIACSSGLRRRGCGARRRGSQIGWRRSNRRGPTPKFDTQLVGKRLEICWPYKEAGATKKIWASGVVKRVADGLTHKRSERCKTILPAGALLWAWDADAEYEEIAGEQWVVLHPAKYNKHVQYAWRFDPCELVTSWCRRRSGSRCHGCPLWMIA